MKYTGWAVLICGLLIGLFALFTSGGSTPSPEATGTETVTYSRSPIMYGFSGVAVAVGLGLLLFGGRGVLKTKNLAVRN